MSARVLLMGVPEGGLEVLYPFMSQMPLLKKGKWINQWEDDVREELEIMKPGEVRQGFIYHSEGMKQYLNEQQIRRVFIYRDPRDMITSFLFSIVDDRKHLHHKYFREHLKTVDQQLLKLVTGFMETRLVSKKYGVNQLGYGDVTEYFTRYLRWMEDPDTCVIRYENLAGGPDKLQHELTRLVDYLWPDLERGRHKIRKMDYLKHVLQMDMWESSTSLPVGEWKEHFTEEVKDAFKQVAGELLIFLGYEKDFAW